MDPLQSLLYEEFVWQHLGFRNVDSLSALETPRAWPEMSHNERLLRDSLLLCQQRPEKGFPSFQASRGFFLSCSILCCTQPVQETACPAGDGWALSMFGHVVLLPEGTGEVKGPHGQLKDRKRVGHCSVWALGRFALLPETNLCTVLPSHKWDDLSGATSSRFHYKAEQTVLPVQCVPQLSQERTDDKDFLEDQSLLLLSRGKVRVAPKFIRRALRASCQLKSTLIY